MSTDTISPVKSLTPKQVLAVCKAVGGDGHTIFAPSTFLKKGIPKEVVDLETRYYKSDLSDPKSTLFNKQGQALVGLDGVYGLNLLKRLASVFDVTYEGKMGRGFEARAVTEALVKHFTPLAKPKKRKTKT